METKMTELEIKDYKQENLSTLESGKYIFRKTNGRRKVVTVNNDPSKTDQQYKEDCDTNTILNKFMRTGQITHLAKRQGTFQDVSEIQDLSETLMIVKRAEQDFLQYPSKIRKKFNNSVTQMAEWLQDPDNNEEAVKLGLKTLASALPSENKPDGGRVSNRAKTPKTGDDESEAKVPADSSGKNKK